MARRDHLRSVRAAIGASLLAGALAGNSWAARDFTPQAGTWVISEELDGKPGRGLAIDVQGNTFFMQVFGYEKNGDATFYTATGQMEGTTVTAPLMQYQGGRSFGGAAQDAVQAGSPGNVTVSFTNGLQGTVQLPGEPARAIERFQMMSADFADKYWTKGRTRTFKVTTWETASQSTVPMRLELRKGYQTQAWELIVTRDGLGRQRLPCVQRSGRDVFACSNDPMPSEGSQDLGIREIQLRIADADVVGTVRTSVDGRVQTSPLTGIAIAASGNGAVITGCGSADYAYVGDLRICGSGISTPVSGTWVIEDELLGKPGRGLAIDVQNGMVLMQIFNYLPSGSPSFHMGSGSYQGMAAELDINRYQGGRLIGGEEASGVLAESTGRVALRFSFDGSAEAQPNRTRGSVQLPGEAHKKIVRMALESASTAPQTLLGQWWLQFFNDTGGSTRVETRLVNLNKLSGNVVSSEDDSVRCERPSTELFRMECVWSQEGERWSAYFFQESNNRSQSTLQVRDRHGNLMGLGQVPLE